MIRAAIVVLALFAACKKADDAKPAPAAAKPAVAATAPASSDGARHIAIEANKDGYTPASIPGKPGEKLVLTFTRTADSSCIAQLKAPDGKMVDLPMNTPVDVAVTVPQTGKVEFACGMDMFHGEVVAQPGA
jgi:plastocyanin domain-containing protein